MDASRAQLHPGLVNKEETDCPHGKYRTPHTCSNSPKSMKHLGMKSKPVKALKRSIKANFYDVRLGKGFLNQTHLTEHAIKEKT